MKKILFIGICLILFSNIYYCQWWQKGGNLIWPYGNVTVEKNISADTLKSDALETNYVSSDRVVDNAARILTMSCYISYPATYISYTVYRNDLGGEIDTVYWDDTDKKAYIVFDGNQEVNLLDYTASPNFYVVNVGTSGGNEVALVTFTDWSVGGPGRAIKCSFFDINGLAPIQDLTSANMVLSFLYIPEEDESLGYQDYLYEE